MVTEGDDRAQSVVIGAVILFGFLVISLSTYQATVVPAQNQQIEFSHEQTVRDDMVGVRNAIAQAATGGTATAEVKLGTRFPSRTLFINPPPAVGRLETGAAGNVSVNVSEATFLADVPSEVNETRAFWTATENFTTRPIVYSPTYRSYDGGPDNITVELTHAYARYGSGATINLTQSPLVVANGRVTLVLVTGNLSESGVQAVSVSPSAVSPVTRRETISNFNVSVPTSLSAGEFRGLLAASPSVDESNITVTPNATTPGRLDVRFADTYEFAIAVVSVGQHDETRRAASLDFVSVEENVTAGESARVVAEVRDQYGNPLGGVRVAANATGWEPTPRNTTSDGRVTFEFNSTGYGGETVQLNFTTEELSDDELSALDAGTPTNATANVSVSRRDDGTAAGLWSLSWEAPDTVGANTDAGFSFPACTASECTVNASNASVLTLSVDSETDGASVSFSLNDSSVARLTGGNQTSVTNNTGVARTELSLQSNGTVNVVAAGGGGWTPLQITVQNLTSPGPLGLGDGSGPGSGGVGEYTEARSTETFSVSNGLWTGISCTDQFVLSNGRPASRPNGDNLQGDVIRLTTRLEDSAGENYTVDVKLARASDGSWNKKKVIIRDGLGNSDNAVLTSAAADRVYGSGQTDLFELSNYDDPNTGSDSFTDFVSRLQRLETDRPVTWQTSRMIGRVDVSLECDAPPTPPASGVATVDGSAPDSASEELRFDLQVATETTKEVANISITSPGNGGNPPDENGLNKIQRTGSNPEGRFTPSDGGGVNKSGELSVGQIKVDGTVYELDTTAIFADGAVLSVNIGKFNGGGATLTYHIADSESNADMIVTFSFTDGTKHEVYIRVTNVNS